MRGGAGIWAKVCLASKSGLRPKIKLLGSCKRLNPPNSNQINSESEPLSTTTPCPAGSPLCLWCLHNPCASGMDLDGGVGCSELQITWNWDSLWGMERVWTHFFIMVMHPTPNHFHSPPGDWGLSIDWMQAQCWPKLNSPRPFLCVFLYMFQVSSETV